MSPLEKHERFRLVAPACFFPDIVNMPNINRMETE